MSWQERRCKWCEERWVERGIPVRRVLPQARRTSPEDERQMRQGNEGNQVVELGWV